MAHLGWLGRVLMAAGATLAALLLIGYFLLPPLVLHLLEQRLEGFLGRRVEVARVQIQPAEAVGAHRGPAALRARPADSFCRVLPTVPGPAVGLGVPAGAGAGGGAAGDALAPSHPPGPRGRAGDGRLQRLGHRGTDCGPTGRRRPGAAAPLRARQSATAGRRDHSGGPGARADAHAVRGPGRPAGVFHLVGTAGQLGASRAAGPLRWCALRPARAHPAGAGWRGQLAPVAVRRCGPRPRRALPAAAAGTDPLCAAGPGPADRVCPPRRSPARRRTGRAGGRARGGAGADGAAPPAGSAGAPAAGNRFGGPAPAPHPRAAGGAAGPEPARQARWQRRAVVTAAGAGGGGAVAGRQGPPPAGGTAARAGGRIAGAAGSGGAG